MRTVALKFGGSSLASAEQFRKVADIVKSDSSRRYVVASAPGKRMSGDTKVTDLLYRCCAQAQAGESFAETLEEIQNRFCDIITGLGVDFDLDSEIAVIREHLETNPQSHYMASRGEYLNSKILAAYLGFTFVDPADYICFSAEGVYDAVTTEEKLSQALRPLEYAVVAGFYGALPDGTIHTFSRGGSVLLFGHKFQNFLVIYGTGLFLGAAIFGVKSKIF